MTKDNLFDVIGEGVYEVETDDLFLPEIDPEDAVGWPETDPEDFEDYRDGTDYLSRLETAYGLTHYDYDGSFDA